VKTRAQEKALHYFSFSFKMTQGPPVCKTTVVIRSGIARVSAPNWRSGA